jgi:hypothetical protein
MKERIEDITLVQCQDCQNIGKHFLLDESGTVLIHTCKHVFSQEIAVDKLALRLCPAFRRQEKRNENDVCDKKIT